MKEKIVGIIGGMGPEATVDLMLRVIKATPALDDADHIRMIVDNNPKIPSRIKALQDGIGESPGPCMADMARKLAAWGADFLVIPCNTAHYYYSEVQSEVEIPVLHMIELTASRVVQDNPGIKTAGVMATTATLKTGLYSTALGRHGIKVIYPSEDLQNRLMESIRTIKTGKYGKPEVEKLKAAAESLVAENAQALILACTELSIIGNALTPPPGIAIYDALQVLTEAIVQMAKSG
jgi:aspartate racemase